MDFSPFEKKKNEILLNNITPPFKPPVAILCLVQVSSSILQYFITPTSLWVFYQHNMDAQRVNIWLSKQGGRNVFQGFSRKRKLPPPSETSIQHQHEGTFQPRQSQWTARYTGLKDLIQV